MDVEKVRERLLKLPLWGDVGIECGIRSGFRCEYCDRDMLLSLDNYKAWAQDHVVPRKFGGGDELENMAVACQPCNSAYKKDWDPRTVAGEDASREELVAAARAMIAAKREAEQRVLEQVRELVRSASSS